MFKVLKWRLPDAGFPHKKAIFIRQAPTKLEKRFRINLQNESKTLTLKQSLTLQWYISQKKESNFNRWKTI